MVFGQWLKAGVFTLGALLYIGLFAWILVVTFQAKDKVPDLGALGGTALVLSGAVGGYFAKLLGVDEGGRITPTVRVVTPLGWMTWVIWATMIAYILIGVACGVANIVRPQLAPDVVTATWKVVSGLVIATFAGVFATQPTSATTPAAPASPMPQPST